jgi:hypothetical protein
MNGVKPRSGARGAAAPGRERRVGEPGVVRGTPLTRHPNLGAAKFG